MMKQTICLYCKTKFKHDKNQERKFCSKSCSTIVNNKARVKIKVLKAIKHEKFIGEILWHKYNLGLVTIEKIKSRMPERYENLRPLIVNSQKP